MRIVFMGSPPFAVPSLNALVEAGHDLIAAYCQPPRPAGRGKGQRATAVQLRAEALGIPVKSPRSLREPEAQAEFAALDPDLAVVAAYGLILPKPILEAPRGGCVNVHASLLPRWRGAAPVQRAILAGDEITGVTIMRMEEGLDTGPMLLKREVRIGHKNAGQVMSELARMGAQALVEWIANPSPGEPQPKEGVTHAAKIAKSEARIDWTQPAAQILRQVRAFAPTPGAWFEAGGERIRLLDAAPGADGRPGRPGEVIDDFASIGCGEGYLRPIILQRAGRAPLATGTFLRGFRLPKGTILP